MTVVIVTGGQGTHGRRAPDVANQSVRAATPQLQQDRLRAAGDVTQPPSAPR